MTDDRATTPPWGNRSLRRRLLAWLLPLYVLVAVAAGTVAYWGYGRLVHTFMDDQMRLLADSYVGRADLPEIQLLTDTNVHRWGSFIVQVWGDDGRLLATSWPPLGVAMQARPGFQEVRGDDGQRWRVYSVPLGRRGVQVVQSADFRRREMTGLALYASVPVAVLMALSLLILYWVVATVSRSLRVVAQSAAGQDERSIADLPLTHVPEEIAPLVASVNALLARLREAFDLQRRFTQDAAHELRTPLTALYLQLENLRAHVPPGDALRRFTRLEAGIQRMRHLIEQLLQLSQQEVPPAPSQADEVDIGALLQDSVNELMALADQRRIDIGYLGEASPSVRANAADLRSVFVNLIDNALRYTPVGGVVDIRLHELSSGTVVDVIDSGPGIPAELLASAFDRFFRVPGSPARGVGLGLAIAQGAAQRNGMRIELMARQGAAGLLARVHLGTAGLTRS